MLPLLVMPLLLLLLQDEAMSARREGLQLQAEIDRLRSKVHQRGFEVLTQQQLLQVAQQQLKKTRQQLQEQQQAAAADSAAAATARWVGGMD
jgi:hypothetical protein